MAKTWEWIKDRTPTEEEVHEAGDIGFICCISGRAKRVTYVSATSMNGNFFEDGKWKYLDGHDTAKKGIDLRVKGWIVPPKWE